MEDFKNKIKQLLTLYNNKEHIKAESLCVELIKKYPNKAMLYNFLGIVLYAQKKHTDAIIAYKKGIDIDPKIGILYSNLANIYKNKKDLIEAERLYKKAIELDKKISEPHNNLANVYKSRNEYDKAIESYKSAIKIDNNFYWAHYNLGTAYLHMGYYEEARESLMSAIKINASYSPAHRTLSRIKKYKKNDPHLFQMQKIYRVKKNHDQDKKELAFALGKAYEDIGDYESSFDYYKTGNQLHRKNLNFSIIDEENEFNEIKKIYNKNFFIKNKDKGFNDTTPIFIIGMPRSGTTLVEQIISSHPKVFGADELNYISEMFYENENVEKLSNEKIENLGKQYIEKIKKISSNSSFVTDKMPMNFKWLGFIKLILPNSIVINCTRNSKDNCFSIYKNFFPYSVNFAFDMNEIVKYYNMYLDLLNHWNNVLPNFIINIKYEKLINDPEFEIKNLIKLCNLTWEDKCMEFYKNKRPIKTASNTQARSKIYKSSIDSWENYYHNLKGFFKELSN